jgi:hypothetical protein
VDSVIYDIEDVDVPLVSGDALVGRAKLHDWTIITICFLWWILRDVHLDWRGHG